jgi:hypothetical protein
VAAGDSGLSQHPVDQLIRELLRTVRPATSLEVEQILDRMATAPFDPRVVPIRSRHRRLTYLGRTLGSRQPALFLHLALRVVDDGQWAYGTTEQGYLADLYQAAHLSSARLAIFQRRGGSMAAIFAPNTLRVIGSDRSRSPGYSWSTRRTVVPSCQAIR